MIGAFIVIGSEGDMILEFESAYEKKQGVNFPIIVAIHVLNKHVVWLTEQELMEEIAHLERDLQQYKVRPFFSLQYSLPKYTR